MPRFEPKNPDYRKVATATFDRQQAMRTLGISMVRIEPGEVELSMPYAPGWTQQNGFVHAGIITAALDTACGIAAFTLMPSRRGDQARPHADGMRGAGVCAGWRC
jgi:acyl-coenzyme A thioesterase PaaI-like protein